MARRSCCVPLRGDARPLRTTEHPHNRHTTSAARRQVHPCTRAVLRGEMQTVKNKKTSALCCMNGELLIDRANVHDPKTRPQTRIDDNPKELEALLCKKLGQYSRELNKMFGLTSIGAKRKRLRGRALPLRFSPPRLAVSSDRMRRSPQSTVVFSLY